MVFATAALLLLAAQAPAPPAATPTPAPAPPAGPVVSLVTTLGEIRIALRPDKAPISVNNFLQYVKAGHYNGTIFHRVIPGFMVQGGDPLGSGIGNPGYKFADEIVPELKFDKPGLLAMANAGPVTNGSQFFITEGTPGYLNGKHTIFGLCEPLSLVTKITGVERGPRDKPVTDVVMKKVTISRGKAKKAK